MYIKKIERPDTKWILVTVINIIFLSVYYLISLLRVGWNCPSSLLTTRGFWPTNNINVFQPGSGCQGFRRNRPKLPGTKLATTVLCGCCNIDTWIIAQSFMSNANSCGMFHCRKRVEKDWTTWHNIPSFRKIVISLFPTLAAYALLILLSTSASSLFLIWPGVDCSSASGIDLLVLTSCISFREIAPEEMFTNINMAPSFFFNSSCLISLFYWKNIHFLSFATFAGWNNSQTVKI